MPDADLVIKNGRLVTHTTTYEGVGIAIKDGKFAAIVEDDLLPPAKETLDAQGLYILPGIMDCHVHFRQPGLEYKAEWYGADLVAVDRFFPSTKTCSACGAIKRTMPLTARTFTCPDTECGHVEDRDVNAAKNILAAGLAVAACGDGVRPKRR